MLFGCVIISILVSVTIEKQLALLCLYVHTHTHTHTRRHKQCDMRQQLEPFCLVQEREIPLEGNFQNEVYIRDSCFAAWQVGLLLARAAYHNFKINTRVRLKL